MKKYGGMMYPNRKRRAAPKRITCAKCKKELTPATAYSYVDGCNCAITNNAPEYCLDCYKQIYKWIEHF